MMLCGDITAVGSCFLSEQNKCAQPRMRQNSYILCTPWLLLVLPLNAQYFTPPHPLPPEYGGRGSESRFEMNEDGVWKFKEVPCCDNGQLCEYAEEIVVCAESIREEFRQSDRVAVSILQSFVSEGQPTSTRNDPPTVLWVQRQQAFAVQGSIWIR